jgi:serine/threonine protein kinase
MTEEKKGLERYQKSEKLGQGGMAEVYLAEDLNLKRTVALKKALESDEPEILRLAEKEAQTLANLKHPNLPTVYDYFVENNGQFIVMEFISGQNLSEIMRSNPAFFTEEKVAEILFTLLNVVDYLHSQPPPIVHRDIKPQNVKISENGTLFLLDFGLVKNHGLHSQHGTSLTRSSKLFGYSKNYSPLEQRKGESTSTAADIYSLCATIYFLLAKQPPVDSLDRAEVRSKGQPDPLPDIRSVKSRTPERVAELIMSGLELHQENRPSSVGSLRQILSGGKTQPPPKEDKNDDFHYQNPNHRFQVSLGEQVRQNNANDYPPIFTPETQTWRKLWLVYFLVGVLLLGGLGLLGYEQWCYEQNKAIVSRLDKSGIDDFSAIETEWNNYEQATKRTSYFQWGLQEAEDKLQEKIFKYADNVIEDYRTGGGKVKKDESFWQRPQKLLERISANSPNNSVIKSKIEYFKGQKDFAFAFEKGSNQQTRLESAQKHYQAAIKLNPKFGDPYFMLALTYIYGKGRDYSRALENIDSATQNGFPFDTRAKAVKGDCLQALADATVKEEERKLKARNPDNQIESYEEARFLTEELEKSLKTVRDKYQAAKNLYEEARGYGTVDKSLREVNARLERLEQGISAVDKLQLLLDVVKSSDN